MFFSLTMLTGKLADSSRAVYLGEFVLFIFHMAFSFCTPGLVAKHFIKRYNNKLIFILKNVESGYVGKSKRKSLHCIYLLRVTQGTNNDSNFLYTQPSSILILFLFSHLQFTIFSIYT